MKKLLIIPLFLISIITSATNYYVKTGGNDSANGLTDGTAWATITKVNTVTFSPGDSILFNRGDTFIGTLTVRNDGTSGSRIVYGAYGTGAKPILTPNDTITGITWVAHGTEGIYKTTDIPYNPGSILINWENKINKIHDSYFATPNPYYNNWTSLDFLRLPADTSWTENGIANIEFWDVSEALFCYDGAGTTYIRFRNGEDPNDSTLAISADGVAYAAVNITSKDYITIRDLQVHGGSHGIYVVGPTTITLNNVIIDSCDIKSSDQKVRISSSNAVTVKNCTFTNNYLSTYLPGAYTNGTAYEDGVQYMYYYFFKVVIDDSESSLADGAVIMSGGKSDNCIFNNNTITGCVNGIAMFGNNMVCHSNTITGTSSIGIFLNPTGPTYTYDNYLTDCNIGFRFGAIDRTLYGGGEHYLYRNKVYITEGQLMYLHYDGAAPSVTEAYVYQNTFVCYEGVQASGFADDRPGGTGFIFINNIFSITGYYVSGSSTFRTFEDFFGWYYNWYSGTCYGSTSTPVWATDASNLKRDTTFWDHSIDPPDFENIEGTEIISAGVDLSAAFTLGGVNYNALPGMNADNYVDDPEIGFYEFDESEPPLLPSVTMPSDIYSNVRSAYLYGILLDDGGGAITARGVVYALTETPDLTDHVIIVPGTDAVYSTTITGLTPSTTYYVRAYATNSKGTSYGEQITFTTSAFSRARNINGKVMVSNGKVIIIR